MKIEKVRRLEKRTYDLTTANITKIPFPTMLGFPKRHCQVTLTNGRGSRASKFDYSRISALEPTGMVIKALATVGNLGKTAIIGPLIRVLVLVETANLVYDQRARD